MEFPAICPSQTLRLPANFTGKPKAHFQILLGKISGQSKINHIVKSGQASTENCSSSSISTTFKDERDRALEKLSNGKSWIHFVGIGGCGLSALAMLAIKQGYEVSGSDVGWSSFMDALQEAGACLHIGHSVTNMQRNSASRLPDSIVVSSAIPQDNVEILYAKSAGVPVYKRDHWLGQLTQRYNLIAFSGGNIILGDGQNFVLEADEYDACFLGLSPYIAVVTNLDWEHVDIFPNEEAVKATFRKFLNLIRVGGHLILCGDSEGAYSLLTDGKQAIGSESSDNMSGQLPIPLEKCCDGYNVTTYGTASSNEWHASSIRPNIRGGSDFTLCHWGRSVAEISLQIPGVHNVVNSLAVIATVIALFSNQIK